MSVTSIEKEMIKDELRRSQDYSKIARRLGVPIGEVRRIDIMENGRFFSLPRPELEKYVVATKHVDDVWDNNDPAIKAARQAYDDGLVEICTGRNGFMLTLYAIPRKEKAVGRMPYFSRDFGEG